MFCLRLSPSGHLTQGGQIEPGEYFNSTGYSKYFKSTSRRQSLAQKAHQKYTEEQHIT